MPGLSSFYCTLFKKLQVVGLHSTIQMREVRPVVRPESRPAWFQITRCGILLTPLLGEWRIANSSAIGCNEAVPSAQRPTQYQGPG